MTALRSLLIVALTVLSACGGVTSGPTLGGIGAPPGGSIIIPPPPVVANTASVVIDAGPAALSVGPNGYSAFNQPYVTITVCAPGSTSNCQTIDHILLDTGSIGLRLLQPVLNATLLAALPSEKDTTGNPVGECYQYVNSFAFGSVKLVDFTIAGEKVAAMPVQVIGDTGSFAAVPAACSAGGGKSILTVQDFGANGIIGVGTSAVDCGAYCASGGHAAATYYDCVSTGCAAIIARAANEVAPFEQLPNPVAAFAVDNNGTIITLPTVAQTGVPSLTGTVIFGIGTQADNALRAATVLPVSTSTSKLGPGVLTVTFNGKTLTQSFIDSGSTEYLFIDAAVPTCTETALIAFYCPTGPLTEAPVLIGTNNAAIDASFPLFSPRNVTASSTAAPGLGVNPTLVTPPLDFANSFDFGLPFFYGKSVYTAIEGRGSGTTAGPFFAY